MLAYLSLILMISIFVIACLLLDFVVKRLAYFLANGVSAILFGDDTGTNQKMIDNSNWEADSSARKQ